MKANSLVLAVCASALAIAVPFPASAKFEVSVGVNINAPSDFYSPLATDGSWVEVGSYGRCWRPAGVTVEWRPYCHGNWEWTDCGWYWVSDEPWAWACYHYGSWVEDPSYGWVWVPAVEWAPAWVSWRTGGDYIGWAPCGPGGVVVAPAAFVFVQNEHFHDHFRPDTVIINNTTIVNQTRELKGVDRERRDVGGRSQTVVINNGPGISTVERATGHKFTAEPVSKVEQSTVRSMPEQLHYRTPSQPPTENKPDSIPQEVPRYKPESTVNPNQEVPRNFEPKHDEVPVERNLPGEKTIPVPLQPERNVPLVPAPKMVPMPNGGLPVNPNEHPKKIVPQNEIPHVQTPPAPVTPSGNQPQQEKKGQDQDHP